VLLIAIGRNDGCARLNVDQPDLVRGGSPDSAVDRVADFYGAYIDAVSDGTDDLSGHLRAHYLTEDLRQRLAAWRKSITLMASCAPKTYPLIGKFATTIRAPGTCSPPSHSPGAPDPRQGTLN
jgi:hypothetical protein